MNVHKKVDKLLILLRKVKRSDKEKILGIVNDIKEGNTESFETKKLRGVANIYRVRADAFRIIYTIDSKRKTRIVDVSSRNEKTYRGL